MAATLAALAGCAEKGNSVDMDDYKEPKGGYAQLKDLPEPGEEIAVMTTNFGVVKMRFFPQYAPKAVENFVTHAKNGYYDGLIFHRVINQFMIQGGDPLGTGSGGESIWGDPFGVEATPQLHNIRGAVSMAKSNAPISIGSQFFIVQNTDIAEDSTTRIWLQGKINHPDKEFTALSGVKPKKANGKAYTDMERMPAAFAQRYLDEGGYPFLDFDYTVFGQVFEGMDIVDAIAATPTYKNPSNPYDPNNDRPLEDVIIESVKIEVYTQ